MEYENIYQVNQLSEKFLTWIQKKQRNSDFVWEDKPCISVDDLYLCCRISQCYQEVVLSKKHSKGKRVLAMARVIRADQQLREAINDIPDLSGYDLKRGDPGLFLLQKRTVGSVDEVELPYPNYVALNSRDEMVQIFRATGGYSFYKRYKKKLKEEFETAEKDLRILVELYRLPGRFSWNAFVEKSLTSSSDVDVKFLDDYSTPDSSVSDDEDNAQGQITPTEIE